MKLLFMQKLQKILFSASNVMLFLLYIIINFIFLGFGQQEKTSAYITLDVKKLGWNFFLYFLIFDRLKNWPKSIHLRNLIKLKVK